MRQRMALLAGLLMGFSVAACGPDRREAEAQQAAARAAQVPSPASMAVPDGAVAIPPAPPGARPPGWTVDGSAMLRTLALCDTGETVELRFFPDVGVAVLVRGGAPTELQAMPSGSGFRYEGNGLTVTGKGSEIRIDGAGAEPLVCTASS